jgi:hypothetical protein
VVVALAKVGQRVVAFDGQCPVAPVHTHPTEKALQGLGTVELVDPALLLSAAISSCG